MADDQYMLQRLENADDIVLGISKLVFIPDCDRERVDDTKAAVLLHFKYGVGTLEQIEQDIREMREFSNKGAGAIIDCMKRIGARYGLMLN